MLLTASLCAQSGALESHTESEKPRAAHLKPSPTVTISTSLSVDVTLISSLAGTGGAGAGVDSITTTSSSRAPAQRFAWLTLALKSQQLVDLRCFDADDQRLHHWYGRRTFGKNKGQISLVLVLRWQPLMSELDSGALRTPKNAIMVIGIEGDVWKPLLSMFFNTSNQNEMRQMS